ncbi:DUF1802 family protein [Planctomicrobium sp. SH664]|uniref:DUF1802 family protein n=1 Tax=Planctomicrobium sp. SH664 TaxID=3448125 RepID=UPI003F5B7847
MKTSNNVALKEWDVVCSALAAGQQRILFRKGGIHEGPDGFQPEQTEFWLYPTGFHQAEEKVRPEFAAASASLPQALPEGLVPIRHYAVVEAVHWIDDEFRLPLLRPFHILTDATVSERFHYKEPGVYVLVVSVSSLPAPVQLPHDPGYDGCRSWVTLNEAIPTENLKAARRNSDITDDVERLLNK